MYRFARHIGFRYYTIKLKLLVHCIGTNYRYGLNTIKVASLEYWRQVLVYVYWNIFIYITY